MRRPPLASRRPASRPAGVRRFKLRLAGLAEVNRLKYDLTMLAVNYSESPNGSGVPEVVDEGPETVRVENVSMKAMVFGNEERQVA